MGHAHGIGVVNGDLQVLGVQQAGDTGPDLPEPGHARPPAVQNVTAAAQQRLSREHYRLADQVVLGVLQRAAGNAEDRAGQLAGLQVAAQPVLGVSTPRTRPLNRAQASSRAGAK
jgi:hypothetical protein